MKTEIKKIRIIITVFIIILVLSGVTAFPIRTEISFLASHCRSFPLFLQNWINRICSSLQQTPEIVLYGTDWLAFAHLIIAIFFIGVFLDPVKNKFIVIAGITACLGVLPLAFIMGNIRGIPLFHQFIDCSFGVLGLIPLIMIYKKIKKAENETSGLPQ